MITIANPKTWQQLQQDVARILRECGFTVQEPRTLTTARGAVEIDVYAEEEIEQRRHVILCECKHWKSRVPQNVVHGFRTVMTETGANMGYIVASSGFQSGAVLAAKMTNVQLVTWQEFQSIFEPTWMQRFWSKEISKISYLLAWFRNPLEGTDLTTLPEADKAEVARLNEQYLPFAWYIAGSSEATRGCGERRYKQLPLSGCQWSKSAPFPPEVLEAQSYRELLEAERLYALNGIRQLHTILVRNRHPNADRLHAILEETSISNAATGEIHQFS